MNFNLKEEQLLTILTSHSIRADMRRDEWHIYKGGLRDEKLFE